MYEDQIKLIREKSIETLKNYFVEDAREIITEIKEIERNPEISADGFRINELRIYEALMNFIAFSTIKEVDQLRLFRTFLVKAFRVGIDIKNRFAIKMNLTPDVLWPETVQLFVEAMLKNEERLGNGTLKIYGEKEDVSPTLGNWLRDYNRIYGMDRHEKIIPHRYITENQNVRQLNQEDQVLLLQILEFYEGLKFPSQSQIQEALENALNQYFEENGDNLIEETETTSEDEILGNVRHELNIDSNSNLDDDIENLIRKFPKVLEQLLSKQPIRLLFNGEWVKPSIANWLADYRAYVGVGEHKVNERSDYLVRSPNVQNLSGEERERLGLLLRSYDEQYMLPFSVAKQEVLFNKIKVPVARI